MDVTDRQPETAFKYFDLYASMRSHNVMLEDRARMQAYHAALFKNSAEMIADKVVLDVGTGTGVLAVWAAKAGAKRVYAVEASNAANLAKRLVEAAHVADVVTVLQAKIEEIEIPEPVDLIVSEWMGSLLIKESMFDSVAYARDTWLKPGGVLLPSHAKILLGLYAPTADQDHTQWVRTKLAQEISEWQETVAYLNSLDVDYSGFTKELIQDLEDHFLRNSIRVNYLSPDHLLSDPQLVVEFDCGTVDPTALVRFSQEFDYRITRQAEVSGFLGWFTTDFPNGVVLDTGPGPTYNHWGQQLYPLPEPLQVVPGDQVKGRITVGRNVAESRLNVVEFNYQVGSGPQQTALFNMGAFEHMAAGSKSVLFS